MQWTPTGSSPSPGGSLLALITSIFNLRTHGFVNNRVDRGAGAPTEVAWVRSNS